MLKCFKFFFFLQLNQNFDHRKRPPACVFKMQHLSLPVFELAQAKTEIPAHCKLAPAVMTPDGRGPTFTVHMSAVTCSTFGPYVTEQSSPQAAYTHFRVAVLCTCAWASSCVFMHWVVCLWGLGKVRVVKRFTGVSQMERSVSCYKMNMDMNKLC